MTFDTNRTDRTQANLAMSSIASPVPWTKRRRRALVSALALAAIVVPLGMAHAADDDDEGSSGNWFDGMGKSIAGGFDNMKKTVGLGKPQAPPQKESPSGCPTIDVLDGTGEQRVMANAQAGNQGLRYQYSIVEVARECQISNGQMVLKVGVTGRVLLGPSGSPGGFKIPIRIAVIDRSTQKPTVSKLYQVDASIPSGQTATPYSLVADGVGVPLGGRNATDFGIAVGIDGAKADKAEKPKHGGPSVAAAADPTIAKRKDAASGGGHHGRHSAGNPTATQ